jgi:hypothetical protein
LVYTVNVSDNVSLVFEQHWLVAAKPSDAAVNASICEANVGLHALNILIGHRMISVNSQ